MVISIFVSGIIAYTAYLDPEKFVPISEFLATIIAILIGVSLAISAVLASPPEVNRKNFVTIDDHTRAQREVDLNYIAMMNGQKILFWAYYASLILAVCLKFLDIYFGNDLHSYSYGSTILKFISVLFAFSSSLALLWSATLPSLLHQINIHKVQV